MKSSALFALVHCDGWSTASKGILHALPKANVVRWQLDMLMIAWSPSCGGPMEEWRDRNPPPQSTCSSARAGT